MIISKGFKTWIKKVEGKDEIPFKTKPLENEDTTRTICLYGLVRRQYRWMYEDTATSNTGSISVPW